MNNVAPITLPTTLGIIELAHEQVFSFAPGKAGGIIIVLKETINNIHPQIISGYPYEAFKLWFENRYAPAP